MSDLSKRIGSLTPEQRAALAERLRAPQTPPVSSAPEPIAVVGMACRVPGADSTGEFWQLLLDRRDAVTEVPSERWPAERLFDADDSSAGCITSKWGGFLGDIDRFDASFFGISPREAQQMDPQQRLLLEVAWEALDDAGQDVDKLAGTRTGIFVGMQSFASDYLWLQLDRPDRFDAFTGTGNAHNIVAGRLSYLWDLRGPAVVVDTACSSSLVAVHLACQSLRSGESDAALAAGVNLILTPLFTVAVSRMHMFSPDGRCKPFDSRADGFVRSEGCGVVVLKRLSDALKNGDTILSVIRGTAMNQDGRTNGITAPNSHAQQAVVNDALRNGRVDPSTVGYVEAHGTGTPLGDPIEAEALGAIFRARPDGSPCLLGSAKANLGHLEGAAGIAGLIKTVLSLRNETVPPLAHFESLSPHLSFEGSALEVPATARPWPRNGKPRRAGVSSFGWSGTNAHVVLEEAPQPEVTASRSAEGIHLLPISARSEEALAALAASYRDSLGDPSLAAIDLRDVCFTASLRRTHHDYRAAVCGDTREELEKALAALAAGERRWDVPVRRAVARRPQLSFVFCGQGPQSAGMGTGLIDRSAAFTETLTRIDTAVRELAGWSVIAELRAPESESRLEETEYAQPALFALQVALAAEWEARGVVPSIVIGHSVGEIAAAHVAGALTLEDAVRIVVHRARLMQRATGYGRMLSTALKPREAEVLVSASGGKLSVAAINGPQSCVLSGDTAAIAQVAQTLQARGVEARPLPVNYAFHSRQMDPILGEFKQAIQTLVPRAARLPIASTVLGQLASGTSFDADYWVRNVRQTVKFAPAVAVVCRSAGSVFLEIGPHPVLAPAITESAKETTDRCVVVASLQRGRADSRAMGTALGALFTAGCDIDWSRVYPDGGAVVSLPKYAWQRQRYWVAQTSASGAASSQTPVFPGARLRSPLFDSIAFETKLSAMSPAYLADHRVNGVPVCPAAAYVALAQSAAAAVLPDTAFELRDMLVQQPLVLGEDHAARSVQTLVEKQDGQYAFRICSLDDAERNAWTTHVTGRIVQVENDAPSSVAAAPLEGSAIDPVPHYDAFEARGLSFGSTFRCIDRLVTDGGSAEADLRLAEDAEPQGAETIHPVLLDGAFHAVWAAMPAELVSDVAYLPFSIDRVRFFRRGGSALRARARRWTRIPAGGETLTGDVTILDDQQRMVCEVSGFTLKRMSADQIGESRRRIVRSWFYEPVWTPQASPVSDATPPAATWILIGSTGDTRIASALLESAGARCKTVASGPQSGNEVAAQIKKLEGEALGGIVFLAGLGLPTTDAGRLVASQADTCATAMSVVQALVASTSPPLPPLSIVTNGAQYILESTSAPSTHLAGDQAPLWGLARSVRQELPELRCASIDLDPSQSLAAQAPLLLGELRGRSEELEVAFRAGVRMVRRLTRASVVADEQREARTSGAVQLRIPVRGVLDNLTIEPSGRRAPAAGEIEIEVKAGALNFRDVLNALGMYPGDAGALGSECAGTIVAVGDGVTDLAIGDDVMAVGEGTLGSYVTTSALLAIRKPADLSFAEAAGMPIAFLTVYEALIQCADLKAGERVLIHAATGGVGLAAVQVALALGAEVFATAGSEHKREFLRSLGVQHVMSSRTVDFAQQVIEATGGAGIDVVLNSLNGEFIERSMAVMAQNGRFVELGKIGIWSPEQVARFRRDIDYSVLYLGDYFTSDPARIRAGLEAIVAKLTAGELQPLPITSYSLAEAAAAFRFMAQAQHIGKVVLTLAARNQSVLRSDATYLITGGLGALGLAVAEWMVRGGVRHITLASRSNPTDAQRRRIARLVRNGARITTVQCDVARKEEVLQVAQAVRAAGPMLRGIVHCAGVLDDGVTLQQTRDRFERVLAPKTAGASNLHAAAAGTPLDFLVFFSSIASLLGSAGQSNYSAANAYLDMFARQLRGQGVPAISVSWGMWGEAGMAAAIGDRNTQRWNEQGISPMATNDAVLALEMAIQAGIPHVGVLAVDWSKYGAASSNTVLRPFLSGLIEQVETRPAASKAPALAERLRRVPAGQRRAAVLQHVRDRALKVLGLAPSFPLDARQGLRDVGLDSLLAIELRNALQTDTQASLPATLAFDYPNLEALTAFLCEGPFASLIGDAATQKATAASGVEALAALSDDDAEAMLLAELAGFRGTGRN